MGSEYKAGEFAIVPNMPNIKDVPPTAFVVFSYLCWKKGKDEVVFPSYSTIAGATGISRSTAIRAVEQLEEVGWIKREKRERDNGSQTSNSYKILQPKRRRVVAPVTPPSVMDDTPPSSTSDTPRLITNKTNNQLTITNVIEPKAHGNEEINQIVTGFQKTFDVDDRQDRRAAQWLRSKYGVEISLAMFAKAAAAQSQDRFCPRTPTLKDFYYQIPKLRDYFKRKETSATVGSTDIAF